MNKKLLAKFIAAYLFGGVFCLAGLLCLITGILAVVGLVLIGIGAYPVYRCYQTWFGAIAERNTSPTTGKAPWLNEEVDEHGNATD